MNSTYKLVKEFQKKYPWTLCWWRTKKHANLVEKNLMKDGKVIFAFAAQNNKPNEYFFNTAVLALTNKRLIIAQDRILIGYKLNYITFELYNDMEVDAGIIWGTIIIDTVKETIYFSNIQKSALFVIQKAVNEYMMKKKKNMKQRIL